MKNYRTEVDDATADIDHAANEYTVVFDTTLGPIRLRMFPDVAPEHCRNIIGLARVSYYDGILFHRVIPGFVAQVGCPLGTGTGGPGYQIKQEFNSRPHNEGTLSMARTNDPDSAGSQVFLCLDRVPHLDNQYTVFGEAADDESLETLRTIGQVPTDGDDRPREEIRITKGEVLVTAKG